MLSYGHKSKIGAETAQRSSAKPRSTMSMSERSVTKDGFMQRMITEHQGMRLRRKTACYDDSKDILPTSTARVIEWLVAECGNDCFENTDRVGSLWESRTRARAWWRLDR